MSERGRVGEGGVPDSKLASHPRSVQRPQASPERGLPPVLRYECIVYVCRACNAVRYRGTLLPPYAVLQAWCGCAPETHDTPVEPDAGERLPEGGAD